MKFVSLEYLWLFWIFPLLVVFYLATEMRRRKMAFGIIAKHLWRAVIPGFSMMRRVLKISSVVMTVLFILLALLRPQWGYELREIKRSGVDIVVLVDVSNSMLAEDVKPNRMERAKRELIDLVRYLHGDRIGLVAFAGESYVACPLTTDYSAFQLFIDQLFPDLIPYQGTNIGGALERALHLFSKGEGRSRAVILITDGEDASGRFDQAVQKMKDQDIPLYAIGLGSLEGAPIPLLDGNGFKMNAEGNLVISKLDEEMLKKGALQTGGAYVRSVTGDLDLEQIYLKGIKEVLESQELASEQKRVGLERFQIPLLLAIVFLVMESMMRETRGVPGANFFMVCWKKLRPFLERKKKKENVLQVTVMFLLFFPPPAFAFSFFNWNRANESYKKEEYDKARLLYEKILKSQPSDPEVNYNLGNTYYRQEKYDEAQKNYLAALNADDLSLRESALYNLGNTAYRKGNLESAVDYYSKTLEMNPHHEKARLNRDFVLKKLQEQEEEEKNKETKNNNEKNQAQDQEKEKEDTKSEEDQGESSQGSSEDESLTDKNENEEEEENNKKENKLKEADQVLKDPESSKEQNEPFSERASLPRKLSEEEATRWLESLDDDPKKMIKDQILKQGAPQSPQPENDW